MMAQGKMSLYLLYALSQCENREVNKAFSFLMKMNYEQDKQPNKKELRRINMLDTMK